MNQIDHDQVQSLGNEKLNGFPDLHEYMICHDTIRGFFHKSCTKLPQGCVHVGGEILEKKINKPTSAIQGARLMSLLRKKRDWTTKSYTKSFGGACSVGRGRVLCFSDVSGPFAGVAPGLLGFNTFTEEGNL